MKMKLTLPLSWLLSFLCSAAFAQDDDFDFGSFEAADDTEIKSYVNNKVTNLSPTKLISFSYDYLGGYDIDTENGEEFNGSAFDRTSSVNSNAGFRFDSNYPVISKSSLIVNAYLNYWESHYDFDSFDASGSDILSLGLDNNELRTTALGAIVFKPLNEKKFLIFQLEAAANGNYDFGDIDPDFGKLKYSATAIYGWKPSDDKNIGFGATRTYRGGRLIYVPVMLYNKTWNERWGTELLLPARGAIRRNFSTKSIVMFGYELEGQSYHLQGRNDGPIAFDNNAQSSDWELNKSEIRARLSWDKSITDFIWFSLQAGAMVNWRFDLETEANEGAWYEGSQGVPFYFRVGLSLVSP